MEFIVIVVGLLLMRQLGSLAALQRDSWFLSLVTKLHQALVAAPWLAKLLAMIVPVAALGVVSWWVTDRWLGVPLFLISLLVFLYSLGRGDLEKDVEEYQEDLGRGDEQAAYHDIAAFTDNNQQAVAESAEQAHQEAVRMIAYRYFERYFAVMFWFILAGAPGALLYRLAVIYHRQSLRDNPEKAADDRWLWLLEWLPARLVGISLAVVGNFPACLARLTESIVSGEGSAEVLGKYALAASATEIRDEDGLVATSDIEALFTRTLIFAVFMVAVFVVLL
ncbi:MAG: regulatory signaling modulator protein AmpE [Porticoccaceae bacterium]